jgi:hypothetical protein
MARPPAGLKHVERLEGPDELKRRLRVILATIREEMTIAEACTELGIGEARFHVLRKQALQGALAGLIPGERGRPPKPPPRIDPAHVAELEAELDELRFELEAARIREELALMMPHVLRRGKKTGDRKRGSGRKKHRRGRKSQ